MYYSTLFFFIWKCKIIICYAWDYSLNQMPCNIIEFNFVSWRIYPSKMHLHTLHGCICITVYTVCICNNVALFNSFIMIFNNPCHPTPHTQWGEGRSISEHYIIAAVPYVVLGIFKLEVVNVSDYMLKS
jgi:hypothetical protein